MIVGAAFAGLFAQNWPRIASAWKLVGPFIAANPGPPRVIRDRLVSIGKSLISAQRGRGDAAKIRALLEIVDEVATELLAVNGAAFGARAKLWRERASNIGRSVRLAEAQVAPLRKKSFARLRSETDALVGEVLEAMTTLRALDGSAI